MTPSPPPSTEPLSGNSRPRARQDVVFRKVGEDWLLFDPVQDRIHVLNLTAALIWSFLDGSRSVDQVIRSVLDAFESDGGVGRAGADEIRAGVDRFRKEGLLEEGPG